MDLGREGYQVVFLSNEVLLSVLVFDRASDWDRYVVRNERAELLSRSEPEGKREWGAKEDAATRSGCPRHRLRKGSLRVNSTVSQSQASLMPSRYE